MALDPQSHDALKRFTMAAQKFIYNPDRMKQLMSMMGTPDAAVQAVHTVMAAIEKQKPIPDAIRPLLGVNIYIAIVDVAQAATKHKPDPGIMNAVIKQIMSETSQQPQPDAQQQAPQQPQGIIAGQMQGAPA